jgi:tripeptide aminopeptidase
MTPSPRSGSSEERSLSGAAAARVAEDAIALAQVPAPPFAEDERAQAFQRLLGEAAVQSTRDAVGNVLAAFGPEGPAIVFAAHLDTVFPAGTDLTVTRDGERLRGPGIGDNSLGLAAVAHLARRLAAHPPRQRVVLAGTVGEEGLGDLRGAKALVQTLACRQFVAVEGHGRDAIKIGGIASRRFRATFTGPGGHPWADRGAPSAVHAMLTAGARAVAEARDAVLNVGTASGGSGINVIAAEAALEVDLRAETDAAADAARERVQHALRDASEGIDVAFEQLGRRPGGRVADDDPLLEAARAARRDAGLDAAEEDLSSTDANAAHGRGIPAITVGMTHGRHAHRLDEEIELAPLEGGVRALDSLAGRLAD